MIVGQKVKLKGSNPIITGEVLSVGVAGRAVQVDFFPIWERPRIMLIEELESAEEQASQ